MPKSRSRLTRGGVVASSDSIADAFTLHRRNLAARSRVGHSSITTDFRVGNGASALAVTNSDRTLGSNAYRLRPDAAERERHGARCTDNNAAYVAYDGTSPRARVTNSPDGLLSGGSPNKLKGGK